jgi:hypothetical protein
MNNYLEIFNEFSILAIAYHLCIFTDFVEDTGLQYEVGWSVIVVTILNLLINTLVILTITFKKVRGILKNLWKKYKDKRAKKY